MTRCPACAAPVAGPPLEEAYPPYRLRRCETCDLIFADPMPAVAGEWYAEHVMYVVRDHFMGGLLEWNHRQFLRAVPVRGGRLLDVGCGTGQFLAAARQVGYRVTGIDFDRQAVLVAQERFRIDDVFAGDLEAFRTQRKDERFDVVTAFEVLEHSPAPGDFLDALEKIVSPGGFLAISVPNRDRWPAFHYDWDCPPHHLTRWSRSVLTSFLERHGFRTLRVATGRRQAESLLHQYLRFGIITRLIHREQSVPHDSLSARAGGAFQMASMAFRVKRAAIKVLALPVDLALHLLGATGLSIYVLAQRTDG